MSAPGPQVCATYTVECWCDGAEWVVHVRELGRSTPAARLAEIPSVARALVSTYGGDDPAEVELVFHMLPTAVEAYADREASA